MDWLCFDYSERDDAEWEQDKEREGDDVNEEGGEGNEQPAEGIDGTTGARISKKPKDASCK